jgi:hypothetical protein
MKRTSSSSRARQGLLGVAVVVGLFFSAPRAIAQQVSISIGYPPGAATSTNASAPPPAYAPPSPRGVAQALAYAQYLQYLQALNYAALRGGSASDVQQYFTNGAAATTVPSAGQPGSSYFTNGAEATVLRAPSAAPAAAAPPTPTAAPTTQPSQPSQGGPYPWPFVPAPPQGPPVAHAPEAAPLPPMMVEPQPPAPVEIAEAQPAPAPVTAMSFEAWLASMGLSPSDDVTTADLATTVTEPANLASGAIARASFAPREKLRRRVDGTEGNAGVVAAVASAFAAGLLLGGLAMFRLRSRRRGAVAPTS